ncbi:hypothetical protein ACFST9_04490 [Hymenobacter monticola]|uniref:Uncharacterized protein n=1 Tax=Hymenobacter monticola TaxID=1705399 RepID=A0ABY4BC51_9BACT|nr:hypothetical protein [Hymenobacter monticola]UOE35882.1 hypothetical protein MTP16_09615 [Hymenobacter monticola]
MALQDYPHKFFGSRLYAFLSVLMGAGFFGVIVSGAAKGRVNEGATLFMLAIAAFFFIIGWRQMTSKTPHLQFGPAGFWTPKLGHLPWHQITLRIGSVHTGKTGSMATIYILERQTRRHIEGIVIGGLDHSSSHIEEALRSYKKADIIT